MIKALRNIFNINKYPESVYNEISRVNTRKILYSCFAFFLLHLKYIYSFRPKSELVTENIYLWKQGIFYAHCYGLAACFIFGLAAYIIIKKDLKNNIYSKILSNSVVFFYLILSVVIVTIDQRITTNNAPFLLVSIALPAIALINPVNSFFFNAVANVFYFYSVGIVQNNPEQLLSLRENGIAFSITAIMINFLVWRSIREKIFQRELIQNQKLELERSNETKDKFFSIIAHDLKGPIRSIVNGLEILDEEDLDDDVKSNLLKQIKSASKNTSDLLDNLLSWALIQKDQLELHPKKCNLNLILDDCVQLLQAMAKEKSISINYDSKNELEIYADESAVKTICRNLLSNAIKYTPVNGTVDIEIFSNEKFTEIIISDSGTGMDKDTLTNLFKIVNNKSLPGTQGEKGTGLGLLLSKEFIDKNKGYLLVESTPNIGSKFKVGLPNQPI